METLYTPAEIAEQLKLKKTTIYELIKRGELHSTKVGKQLRISSLDLAQYLNQASQSKEQPESAPLKQDYLQNNSGLVLSGQTQVLDLLCAMLQSKPGGLPVLRSYMNSYNSLYSLYFEKVHGAVCSLWQEEINAFDLSILTHFLPGTPFTAVHLCKYRLGLYVKKGNPKNISPQMDFYGKGIRIINREKGSEPRRLMDALLTQHFLDSPPPLGYQKELLSNQTVAAYVAAGNSDMGIGSESTAFFYEGLDFIPVEVNSVDLIYHRKSTPLPAFAWLAKTISSQEFKDSLSLIAGYDTSETGMIL